MVPSFQTLWHLWSTASSTISMSTASSSIASFIPTAFGSLWNSMVPWKAGFGHYFDVASVSSLSVRRLNPSTISMLLASAPLCPPPCSAGGSMRGLFGTSATSLVDMLVLMTPLATHGSQGTLGQSDSLLDIHSAFAALRRWPCLRPLPSRLGPLCVSYLLAVSVFASALPLLSALLPLFRKISGTI